MEAIFVAMMAILLFMMFVILVLILSVLLALRRIFTRALTFVFKFSLKPTWKKL